MTALVRQQMIRERLLAFLSGFLPWWRCFSPVSASMAS